MATEEQQELEIDLKAKLIYRESKLGNWYWAVSIPLDPEYDKLVFLDRPEQALAKMNYDN